MADSPGHTDAAGPLLETKLYIPRWRSGLVSRPRLIERLHQGARRKLTLVSAPAGFGKTTLLAEWLAATPPDEWLAAWVSLDAGDNDPAIFWTYVIAALRKIRPDLGETARSLLHAPQSPPIESILTTLINDASAIEDDAVLVLDDYHAIENRSVHEALAFLLDHLPPRMHLIITSRSDPPLPLARYRGRGESTELRAADLSFTPDEAARFLNNVMDLDLSANDVAALKTRTEGWIAGLQLAALSMQGRADVPGFIQTFAGDDRQIVDYLVEEVLLRQPEEIRGFLLQTSILDRLAGWLCDAVTGRDDGREMLEDLERGNLFIVPLDDKRQWYRYHHLFADMLQSRLMAEHRGKLAGLHLRASQWHERHGLEADAIRHALASGDDARAAALIERAWSGMHRTYQDARWLDWVKALPDASVRARAVLSAGYAWALLNAGELEAGEARLQDAERWLERPARSQTGDPAAVEIIVEDEHEFRFLPATIASARAFLAGAMGDAPGALTHARRAAEYSTESDSYVRGRAAAMLGLAYWSIGDLEAAHRTFADGMADIRQSGDQQHLLTLSATYILADIRIAQGRLREAAAMYEQALQLAAGQGESVLLATALLLGGLSDIHRERGDLETARRLLEQSEDLGKQAVSSEPQWSPYWLVIRSRLIETLGDPDGALALLDEAERRHQRTPVPDVRPIGAMRARIWIRQGNPADALAWARSQRLSIDDDLSYLREFEHITLARALIAHFRSDRRDEAIGQAMRLLERLLAVAEEGERTGSVIEILMLQALAHRAQGDRDRALAPLNRALTLAEPEGYVRIFVDEGEPMQELLRHAAAGETGSSYARQLLSAFDDPIQTVPIRPGTGSDDLVEPLTPREIEILRLIAAGLRNQEIADQLFISLATVKRHIANAYGKLDVSHRTEAVARANELKLL